MKTQSAFADDHSRNGHSTETPKKGNAENILILLMQNVGVPNHHSGYSLDVLANFFNKDIDFASYCGTLIPEEQSLLNDIFSRIADNLDFNVYLQRKVAVDFQGKFTDEQLACIFQAYNSIWINYQGESETQTKSILLDYIDHEGQAVYAIGDITAFKELIESINKFEFEIFVNLILEIWGMGNDMIGNMHTYLLFDSDAKNLKS